MRAFLSFNYARSKESLSSTSGCHSSNSHSVFSNKTLMIVASSGSFRCPASCSDSTVTIVAHVPHRSSVSTAHVINLVLTFKLHTQASPR